MIRTPDRWFWISLAGHIGLSLLLLSLRFEGAIPHFSVIAGPGAAGGLGSALEVGLVDAKELAHLFPPQGASGLTPELEPMTARVQHRERPSPVPELILPGSKPKSPEPGTLLTDRPLAPRQVRLYTGRPHQGGPSGTSALVGPDVPVTGGVGLGSGAGLGTGISGGSEYGRRLQQALSSYYRFTPLASGEPRFVIVRVRIARTGRILSLTNGRVDPNAFLARSGNPVIDARVEAALLELDRHPIPFPPDFLPGAREAIAEIYFRY